MVRKSRSGSSSSMITFTTHCENGHKCTNGSQCVSNKDIKLNYNCDCDEKNDNPALEKAELYCNHKGKLDYCASPPSPDDTHVHFPVSFCTNMGTCKAKITSDESHPGCNCRPGYSGSYCQYAKDIILDEDENMQQEQKRVGAAAYDQLEPSSSSSTSVNNDEYSKGAEIFIFTVLTIVGIIIVTAIASTLKRRRDKQQLDDLTSVLGRNNEFSESEDEEEESFAMYEMQQKGRDSLKAKMEFL